MKRLTEFLLKKSNRAAQVNTTSSSSSRTKVVNSTEAAQSAANISTCGVHDETKFPHVKALEYCQSCEIGMCYLCGNEHADQFHTVDWGFDIFNRMESPRNETNDLFNQGYRATVDLDQLRCPCGNKIAGSRTSTFCAACGTATCSAECHDRFAQSTGKCLFIRNFVENEHTSKIQGLRSILWINQFAMINDNHAEGTSFSRTSPKFKIASLGPTRKTIYLQRGYRQYGQPLESTLEAIVDIEQDESHESYMTHLQKLCTCECEHCSDIAPHSVHNCFYKCKKRLTFDDATMNKLGLYMPCHCQCTDCVTMPGHMRSDCFDFCQTSPFNK